MKHCNLDLKGAPYMPDTVRLVEFSHEESLSLSPVLPEVVARTAALRNQWAVIIRRQEPYVLLGPKDQRLPHLQDAVAWLRSLGYPVFVRIGGGSAVLIDHTCLSFGVARPCRDLTTWEQNFRELCQGTLSGLALLGINAQFGRAEGSYCEGPFDLVYGTQKIAGIAQAIRGGFALVSGMLMVQQDPEHTTMVLQEFYQRAGSDLKLNPDAVTALARLPGQSHLTVDMVHEALVKGHGSGLPLEPEPLTEAEWRLARQLYRARQVGVTPIEEAHYAGHH